MLDQYQFRSVFLSHFNYILCRSVLILIFLGWPLLSASEISKDSPRAAFDLKKTIQWALEHSPELNSIQKRLEIAELEEKSAFYRFFPSLDLSLVHGIDDSKPRITTLNSAAPWSSRTTLSLTQSLYDNGETSNKYKIAELSKKQAQITFQDQRNKSILNLLSLFLDYSLAAKVVEIQDKQFVMMTKQYQSVSKEFYQGLRTQKDYLRFKTQVNRIEIDLATAKNNLIKARLALLKQIGETFEKDLEIHFSAVDLAKIRPQDSKPRIENKTHYLFQNAELQRKINELNSDFINSKLWPEVLFTAAATYGSSQYLKSNQSFSDNETTTWTALITIKYNFLDWGLRRRDANIADLKKTIQNNDLEIGLLSLESTLKELELKDQQIRQNFSLAADLLKLEKDNLGFLQAEYRNGKVQYLDLITGYSNLADAELKFYTAASELELLKWTTLYHQGRLYEEILM